MLSILIIFGLYFGCISAIPCQFRAYGDSGVCVCTEKVCDTLDYLWPSHPMEYVLYTTSKSGERFTITTANFTWNFEPTLSQSSSSSERISIDRTCRFQRMIGWGMAMTGSASINLAQMTSQLQQYVYRDYYSQLEGANFNWLRMPIGACDFDIEPWQYNLTPINDTALTGFKELDPHDALKVQQIQELKRVSGIGDDLKVMFSAWSPPPWMKSNNAFSGSSFLLTEYYSTWALFHLKFLQLMKMHNISAYAITTGNEPSSALFLSAYVNFLSLGWFPSDQGRWIREYLGPAMRQSEFADVKIFAVDDQRYILDWFLNVMGEKSMEYIDGIAVHWYTDSVISPIFLDRVVERYPDKPLMNTESSTGALWFDTPGILLGSWNRAEYVSVRIMEDLLHGVTGWIEWNLVLDIYGGPNYAGNYVDGLIIFNKIAMEYYKQPWYYVFGHFSKFIPEGSVRICANPDGTSRTNSNISMVAFTTPNGTISVVLSNKGDTETTVTVSDEIRGFANVRLMAKSINTMSYS